MEDRRCKPQVCKSLKMVLAQIPAEVEQVFLSGSGSKEVYNVWLQLLIRILDQ